MRSGRLIALACLLVLACCSGSGGDAARARAARLAEDAGFHAVIIAAAPFHLAAYLRVSAPSAMLRVYIEGDGHAWNSTTTPSGDPTPWEPVSLELAVRDPAPAVAYLARPCQYVSLGADASCNQSVWTDARYSPVVVVSTNAALDRLKTLAGASVLELVGYSGGGAVAALAAAGRTDVRNLRTVAADLDIALWTREHGVSPLSGSLNPTAVALQLAALPQLHFAGGADRVVDASVIRSYAEAAGSEACLRVVLVPDMEHGADWTDAWPRLLGMRPGAGCARRAGSAATQ